MGTEPCRPPRVQVPPFLTGGGDLAPLIASIDWSNSPLGPLDGWPQSLRTALSICLNSRFPIAIWWGAHGVQFYNEAYLPVVGAKHPGSMGEPAAKCWAEAWPVVGPLYDQVFTTGESTWSEDLRIPMRRFGFDEESYFTFSYSAIRDETGGVGGLQVTCIETTDRVLGERRLQTLRALSAQAGEARTVINACDAAIRTITSAPGDVPFAALYLLDSERHGATLVGTAHLTAGAACPRTIDLGYPDDDRGWPIRQVVTSGRSAIVGDVIDRFGALPSGPWPDPPRTAVVLPVAQPGQPYPAAILVAGVSPAKPLDDAYRGFFELLGQGLASTIASARAYEDERQRAEDLAAVDRAKTAFFSNVSHEFRTPLTLLLGPMAEMLEAADIPAHARQALETAHRNSLRLLKLVNTLLDFSRIEAGRIHAVYEPVDLAALTAELASVFRSAIEKAGMRLVVDCAPLNEPVYVDRDMWEKIVLNLLSNAFKFTFQGDIRVALRQAGSEVKLTVSDTGTGIPEAELPHLFERFHRVKGSRGRSYEGSGIGLAMVQELAKLHGGSVSVESAVDRGTMFTVSVPAGRAHLPADHIGAARTLASTALGAAPFVEEALRWLPGEESRLDGVDATNPFEPSLQRDTPPIDAQTPSPPRPRIVWADDNADMRDYVVRLLAPFGSVEPVSDGRAALAAIHREIPDLVLADVMMPGLDGFELLRAIRSEPRTADIPVVLLSARAGEESRVEGLTAGADDYLIKPFSARELLARVETHVKLGRLRRELALAHQRNERRLKGQGEALMAAVNGAPLETSLGALVRTAIDALEDGVRAAFYLADADGSVLHHVVGMSAEYAKEVNDFAIGPESLACGLATHLGEPVITTDVHTDPRWGPWRWLADRFHYRGCWSFPIHSAAGTLVGTLALYWPQPRHVTAQELELTSLLTNTAAIIISRHRESEVRQRAEDALAEREALLKELHHRVKNNLQVITSLLEMQVRQVNDASAISSLTEARNRVTAIASIHELLYQSGSLSRVDLVSYARRLVPHVVSVYAKDATIKASVRGGTVTVDLARAVPIGLLLNELISNACKHAFPTTTGGELTVTLGQDDGHLTLRVADSGIGLPHQFVERSPTTLGLQLVYMLAKQVGGSVAFHRTDGTTVDVTVPK
jgi:signal transduction histidine kinase/CheY-like chemotaxis protein